MWKWLNQTVTAIAIAIVASMLLVAWLLYRQPRWALDLATQWSGDRMLFYFETDEPVVALTIDDGPDPDTTADILDVLEEHQAKATFFIISDHIEDSDQVLADAITAGMEMGNHMQEDRMSLALFRENNRDFLAALTTAEDTIIAASGTNSLTWYRPGQGLYSTDMLKTVEQEGYQSVLGSVFPYDTLISSADFSTNFILDRVEPGSIIVLHDRDRRGQRTVETLEQLLPELAQRGYRVTTLSELADIASQAPIPDSSSQPE